MMEFMPGMWEGFVFGSLGQQRKVEGREQERRCLSPCRDAVTKCPEMINQEKKDLGSLAVQGTAPRGREGKALRAHICGQKKRPGGGCTRLIPSPHLHRPGWQQTMPSTVSGPS